MKKSVVRWCLGAFAGLLAFVPGLHAQAQSGDPAPAVVVTLGPADSLLKDIGYLTKAAGQPQAGGILQIMAGQYLAPMDTQRPTGMYLSMDTGMPVPVVFMPVKDFDGFVSMISEQMGSDPETDGDYTLIPMNSGEDLYLIHSGDWTYASNTADGLENLPNDPTTLLAGTESYDVAVRVFGQNIPEDMKAMAMGAMREGFEEMLNSMPPEQAEIQREMNSRNIENLEQMVEQLDELTIGLNIDQDAKEVHLDFVVTGTDGSSIAESSTRHEEAVSEFLGFINDSAAIDFSSVTLLGEDDIAQLTQTLESAFSTGLAQIENDGSMSGEEIELAKSLLGTLQSALTKTIESGRMDAGVNVTLNDETVAIAGGVHMLETDKIEAAVKQLVEIARQDAPPGTEFNLDALNEDGVNWHEIVIPIGDFNDDAYAIFGDSVSVWLGVAQDKLYFSVGKNADQVVHAAIAASDSAEATDDRTMQADVHVGRIVEFAAGVQDDEPVAGMIADAMEGLDASMSMYGDVIENGSRGRLVIREDLIKALGQLATQLGAGANAQF